MSRKRTSKHLPAKGRLRDMADRLWSKAVISDWGNRCAMCMRQGGLNAHHLIPRQHMVKRYDLSNGICLCGPCHQFDIDRSPHQCAAGFILWLEEHHPTIAQSCIDSMETGTYRMFNRTTNAQFYVEVIRSLRDYVDEDDYTRILGQRFAAYLDSQERTSHA